MVFKKSRKRILNENKEFMPLSKGKLFESDNEDNCQYDWGFKKSVKANEEESSKAKRPKIHDKPDNVSKKLIYAKNVKPYEIKKTEDKELYMDNLSKVYNRSYVYIPGFINVYDISENTDKLIEASMKQMFRNEIELLEKSLNEFWIPLNERYVETNRLSGNCSASQMIAKCLAQSAEAKKAYENCLENFSANAAEFRSVLKTSKDVDSVANIFRDSVGNILLKYKDSPNVSFEEMSNESNKTVFMRMVNDGIAVVKSRVEKSVKARKQKEKELESEESEEEIPAEAPTTDRPVSRKQMANKGLVPRRKKADANPRVKHRMKFKKAIVRHHSQVPRTRDDIGNYQGEQSGIRIGVIKSKKFK